MIFNFKTVDQNNVFYIGRFTIKYNTTTYIDVETLSVDQLNELQEIVASEVVVCTNQTLDTVLTTIKSAIRSKSANIVVDQIQIPGPKGDDGLDGEKGEKGDPGLGIPEGGVAGDILVKKSSLPFDTDFFPLKTLFPLSNHENIKLEFKVRDLTKDSKKQNLSYQKRVEALDRWLEQTFTEEKYKDVLS